MQRTKLFLIRHGETESNKDLIYKGQGESPLSESGKAEAQKLAKALKDVSFSAIYCSTLGRSKETARIIAQFHKDAKIFEVKELMERYYGIFEDKSFDELQKEYAELYNQWLCHPNKAVIPEAETLEQVQKRAVPAVLQILKKHEGKNILIAGHGGMNRTVLFNFLNLDLDYFFRIKQDNCCVNIIEFDSRGPMVVLLNSTFFIGEQRINKEGRY